MNNFYESVNAMKIWKAIVSHTNCIIKIVLLNDLYDTNCRAHNRFSNFQCVYTIKQVVLTDYLAFKSLSKIIQEQAAAAVIIALIFEKNKSSERSLCKTLA